LAISSVGRGLSDDAQFWKSRSCSNGRWATTHRTRLSSSVVLSGNMECFDRCFGGRRIGVRIMRRTHNNDRNDYEVITNGIVRRYTIGSVYTSLTGFSAENCAGSVQLAAIGRLLCGLGFSLWDLGMEMNYKKSLGSHLMPRKQFLEHIHQVRESRGGLVLPTGNTPVNAKTIIDQTQSLPVQQETENSTLSPSISRQPATASHQPPFDD
jgi:hypothetical protein